MAKKTKKPRARSKLELFTMTNRELYLRNDLAFLRDELEASVALKHLPVEEREQLHLTPERAADRLNAIFRRAFDGWEDRCNDNCKTMYFCSRKKNHKGKHETDGLVWD